MQSGVRHSIFYPSHDCGVQAPLLCRYIMVPMAKTLSKTFSEFTPMLQHPHSLIPRWLTYHVYDLGPSTAKKENEISKTDRRAPFNLPPHHRTTRPTNDIPMASLLDLLPAVRISRLNHLRVVSSAWRGLASFQLCRPTSNLEVVARGS